MPAPLTADRASQAAGSARDPMAQIRPAIASASTPAARPASAPSPATVAAGRRSRARLLSGESSSQEESAGESAIGPNACASISSPAAIATTSAAPATAWLAAWLEAWPAGWRRPRSAC